jgi:carboxyl-terminal processing protease
MFQFMKNKILIPFLVVGALAAFFSFRFAEGSNDVDDRRKRVLETVMKTINEDHYTPRNLDDSFSTRVYHRMIESLDYEKKFFTQKDMELLGKHEFTLDDEIKKDNFDFFNQINEIFSKRINDAEAFYKDILSKPFNFNGNDSIILSGDRLTFPKDDAGFRKRWNEYLKYRVLSKFVDSKKEQEQRKEKKDKDKTADTATVKTDEQLEKEARESVSKNQETFFKRLRKIKEDDRFAIFINAITQSEDPHTDYLPPKDKQRFDEAMSGSFFGIGAQLKEEEGKIKIVAVLPGTPAKKQGQLRAGDEIQKVAQGSDEPVDVQGWDIDDVVQKIRGKKGTEVRLTVKHIDGAMQIIPIIRDAVQMEETFAKSVIIKAKEGNMGYIYLPEFYADFNRSGNGRRCFIDVAIEVEKLNKAGVKGIILDLRGNGGGSLEDVVQMGGIFIDNGPMVQVKSSGEGAMHMDDERSGTLYDGPLVIMVNQGSASASEILAAAMQDYKRAVIVGSPTFGKGTVQRLISLDDKYNRSSPVSAVANTLSGSDNNSPMGSIKITFQKFYRINGGSTQLKGVTPDIILPDPYSEIEVGERRDKAALQWDEIPAANYQAAPQNVNAAPLVEMSKKRVVGNPSFKLIQENALKIKEHEDNNVSSLNGVAYRKSLDEANATSKKMEEIEKKGTPLQIVNVKEDLETINQDSSRISKNADWIKNLQKDIYLSETVNILNDLYKQQPRVNLNTDLKR